MSNDAERLATAFLERLTVVERRLAEHAGGRHGGRTSAELVSGERWEAGDIWAHLAEFIPYWVTQAERLIAKNSLEPIPFGRTKANPERIAAIERERDTAAPQLWQGVREDINDLRAFLRELPDHGWRLQGRHQTLGLMSMPDIIEEFLIGHLEEHADQLDSLRLSH